MMIIHNIYWLTLLVATTTAALAADHYKIRQVGAANTPEYSIYFENENGIPISPFHDLPFRPNPANASIYNMVVEIPRWHNAKLEINRTIPFNPIRQDKAPDDGLRYIPNIFPFFGYVGNYGAIPQTWEDPNVPNHDIGTKGGDNDPIDVIEIGDLLGHPGQIKQVKILGALLMIDNNYTDWKIVAVDINDKKAHQYNDIDDVEDSMLTAIKHWYAVYKEPDGSPENNFGFDGRFMNKTYTEEIVQETHGYWQKLVNGTTRADDISTVNLSVNGSAHQVKSDSPEVKQVPKANPIPDAKQPASSLVWSHVSLNLSF
ncbi:inorganic pyrophosphatase [Lichtheimia corymbifera JMRC:FSU:9682]|uniref:inorganic diphosphatase n=1 Tax=Lichtheimia corymbifera JMRC:FSU:9682 TaxID=1263082 RepID=A0A068S1L6_9FUNG|nr:inorganic pyrophosphatase [Lichtheimia corymbifera JMRC:FSU:9682]